MVMKYRISFIVILSMTMVFITPIALSAPADFSGTYRCSGTDPTLDTPAFKEDIVLKKDGNNYKAEIFTVNAAIPYFIGKAIINKDINNAFALLFWNPTKPDRKGTELFLVNSDGSISGIFGYANMTNIGNESCHKISAR